MIRYIPHRVRSTLPSIDAILWLATLLCVAALLLVTPPPSSAWAASPDNGGTASGNSAADDSAAGDPAAGDPDDEMPEPRRAHHANRHSRTEWGSQSGGNVVSIGHDSTLESGQRAQSVVSIFGSSTSAGAAVDVVSVFGNSRATGPVDDSVVAVVGDTYIDSKVDGDAVAVIGTIDLGPHAEIGGDVVSVIGGVHRDPGAIVHGAVQSVFFGDFGDFRWLRTWIVHCLLLGRPLAPVAGLGWAWGVALGFLALYAGLALLFRPAIDRCAATFQSRPGSTLVAAILALLLTPVLIILLCATIIGIAAVPFVATAILSAILFGKAAILAWIGSRVLGAGAAAGKVPAAAGATGHPALAVLVGGAIMLVLYVVPVVGFLAFNMLGMLGFGAVVYTLILAVRTRQGTHNDPRARAPDSAAEPSTPPAFSAASTSPAGDSTAQFAGAGPQTANAALPRAGFWIRMAALTLDAFLVGFALSVLDHHGHLQLLALATYGAVMWKLRGSTVGGIVCDLQVVRLDGRELGWETAIVRALGCFLSLAVVGLGFIWIAFDAEGQAWHDKIAGTVVVRVRKGPAASPRVNAAA